MSLKFVNWAQAFKETPTCDDILKRVRKTEITYWVFQVICVIITLAGFNIVSNTPVGNMKKLAIGILLLLIGTTHIAVMKIWAHIKLTMYFIIWDRENRLEAEMKKMEAKDL